MGNICEAIGVTRKDTTAFGNQTPSGNSANDSSAEGVEVVGAPGSSPKDSVTGESKSPTVTTKKRAESVDTNTAEIKLAFAKKQSDEAAAAAAIEVLTGPRLRLLPHQHTLFCERKVLTGFIPLHHCVFHYQFLLYSNEYVQQSVNFKKWKL